MSASAIGQNQSQWRRSRADGEREADERTDTRAAVVVLRWRVSLLTATAGAARPSLPLRVSRLSLLQCRASVVMAGGERRRRAQDGHGKGSGSRAGGRLAE